MTCIAGIVSKDGYIYMGCDSLSSGRTPVIYQQPKIIIRKDKQRIFWIFGVAGSSRIKDILECHLELPDIPESQGVRKFLVSKFTPNLHEILRKHGLIAKKDNLESMDGIMLLGICGRLFTIASNFAVVEGRENYAAVGSGDGQALGSLFSTRGNPRTRLLTALKAAERFDDGVRRPFHILKIPGHKK